MNIEMLGQIHSCQLSWGIIDFAGAGDLGAGARPAVRSHHSRVVCPETRNPKPEAWNPKPEARNPKHETRNPKLETLTEH